MLEMLTTFDEKLYEEGLREEIREELRKEVREEERARTETERKRAEIAEAELDKYKEKYGNLN